VSEDRIHTAVAAYPIAALCRINYARLYNNIICNNQAGLYLASFGGGLLGCSGLVQGNFIYGNGAANGGGLSGCSGTIQNNLIWNNQGGGLDGCSGVIQNNTIVGNTGGGVTSCSSVLTNCIIWANSGSQISDCPYPAYSCIQDWLGYGVGNTSNDPKFVNAGDPAGVDGIFGTADDGFHLLVGSPCIDTGTSLGAPATDITGIARPQGAGIDMGAYEGSAPNVSAGPNLTVILPAAAVLNGFAISSNALVTTWSEVSGLGNVTFGNPSSTNTTATFSMPGMYVLRLTASDGVVSASSDATANVIQCTYLLSATNANFGAAGGADNVVVSTTNLCTWAATSSVPWIVIVGGGTSTTGSATVAYTVLSNATNTNSRTGTMTIAGQTFTVTQASNAPPQVLSVAAVPPVITLPVTTVNLSASVTDDGELYGTLSTTWSKVSGVGTVTFGSLSATNTTATFSTNGTYVLRLTASDGALSASKDVTVIVNARPQIISSPTTTNSLLQMNGTVVVLAGEPATFTVGAFDADGNPLSCLWVFGDGGTSTNYEPTHVFTNCGPQAVSVTISDGIASTNASLNVAVPCLLNIANLQGTLNFAETNADSCTVKGTFNLPESYNFAGKLVTLDIGGAEVSFTLSSKGTGRNGLSIFNKPTYNKRTGLWTFSATLKNGSWHAQWADYGMANLNIPKPGVLVTNFPAIVVVDTEAFMGTTNLHYTAKQDKSGTAK
jgi:hypothetical protein